MRLVNVGFGNMVAQDRLLVILSPDAAPTKRLVQEAREGQRLIDASAGRRTRSVLILDTGHVVLSSLVPETLGNRFGAASQGGNA